MPKNEAYQTNFKIREGDREILDMRLILIPEKFCELLAVDELQTKSSPLNLKHLVNTFLGMDVDASSINNNIFSNLDYATYKAQHPFFQKIFFALADRIISLTPGQLENVVDAHMEGHFESERKRIRAALLERQEVLKNNLLRDNDYHQYKKTEYADYLNSSYELEKMKAESPQAFAFYYELEKLKNRLKDFARDSLPNLDASIMQQLLEVITLLQHAYKISEQDAKEILARIDYQVMKERVDPALQDDFKLLLIEFQKGIDPEKIGELLLRPPSPTAPAVYTVVFKKMVELIQIIEKEVQNEKVKARSIFQEDKTLLPKTSEESNFKRKRKQ